MAEKKKVNPEEIEIIESSIAAELTENDDIVEYIQPNSLELLKARYAAAEEDESIRNEGFEPVKKAGLIKKQRPESTAFDYFAAPVSPREEIKTDVDSPLSQVFDSTKSEFDADNASFSDISIAIPEATPSAPEYPEAVETIPQPEAEPQTSQEFIGGEYTSNNRYGYNTHTRVIYIDESADDGIQRNSEEELSSAFITDSNGKRRFSFWKKKKM